MELFEVLELCASYRALGDAVIEQLLAVVEDDSEETLSRQNGNALIRAADWLDKFAATRGAGEAAADEARDLSTHLHRWVGR